MLRMLILRMTQVQHEQHECNTSATLLARVQHKCDTSVTRTKRVRQEWKNLISITTLVKTYFHILIFTYIYLLIIFTKNYLLEMPRFRAKMGLKSAPQKRNFLIANATSTCCTLDRNCKCPCTFPHSYPQ